MRNITFIVIHCSANSEGSKLRMSDIDRYHRSLGWNGCGYHYVIPTDGTIERGREESVAGRTARDTTATASECAMWADWQVTAALPRTRAPWSRRMR